MGSDILRDDLNNVLIRSDAARFVPLVARDISTRSGAAEPIDIACRPRERRMGVHRA
jgi:hypothetical protein